MRNVLGFFIRREPWWPSGLCSIEPEETETPPGGGTPPPAGTPPPPPAPTRVVGNGGDIPPERVSDIRKEAAAKARRDALIEEYGTADEADIAQIKEQRKKDSDELKAKRDTEKAKAEAEMTETEKLRAQLLEKDKELETERNKSKTHAQRLEEEKQDRIIVQHASKHVAPKYVKAAKVEFAEYVEGLTKAQIGELTPAKIDKWFEKYAKDNPALAVAEAPKPKTAEELEAEKAARGARTPAVPPKRVGAPRAPVRPAPPAGGAPTKHPRDMNPAEFKAHMKKLGRPMPY